MQQFTEAESFANMCPGQITGPPAVLFMYMMQNLISSHCGLQSSDNYPSDYGEEFTDDEVFDFVVVGAGSAGSVVANRLSENKKWRVLVIEAGGDPSLVSEIPALLFSTQGTEMDWKYASERSENSCLGMVNKRCSYPRGRVLGGCSSINAMLYVRGNRDDYDEWERLGNPGWNYESVLKYFKKSEGLKNYKIVSDCEYNSLDKNQLQNMSFASKKFHSADGYLSVENFGVDKHAEKFRLPIYEAFEEIGIPFTADINGKKQIGITKLMGTLNGGTRSNTAKMFLGPIKDRPNLHVIKNAIAQKLVMEGNKVVAVEFIRDGKVSLVRAKKEVIVSAGAINSPQLLMLSGIGPTEHLKSLDIPVIVPSEGVGQNLQDHVVHFAFPFSFPVLDPHDPKRELHEFYHYVTQRSGSFSSIGLTDMVSFVDTLSNSEIPDIEYHFVLYSHKNFYIANEVSRSMGWKKELVDQLIDWVNNTNVLSICPTLLKPKSRGRIELVSRNVMDPPKIIANLLEDEEDLNTMVRGIERLIKLEDTCSFSKYGVERLNMNIPECNGLDYDSDAYFKCNVKHIASSIYHPVGTCKMGPKGDLMAVVDHRLRVYNVEGLRVADASIMPTIVRGNTNAPSIMIGEKVADMIKADWSMS